MKLTPAMKQILQNLGIDSQEALHLWLNPPFEGDVSALPNIKKFRGKILQAKKVWVFCDYDADGMLSAAIWKEALGDKIVGFTVAHRYEGGYGFSAAFAEEISKENCDTVLVLDCGTLDVDAGRILKASRKTMLVVDHHTIGDGENVHSLQLGVVVNPQLDPEPQNTHLCTATLSYLISGCRTTHALCLAAIGCIADYMPMNHSDNRALIKHAKRACNPEWMADPSFGLIPLLNAPGRLGNPRPALEYLLDPSEENKKTLRNLNARRQRLQKKLIDAVHAHALQGPVIFINPDPSLPVGIYGSAASRLSGSTNKPVIVYSQENGGSARIPGHLVDFLSELKKHFPAFLGGGHQNAFGLKKGMDPKELFRQAENAVASCPKKKVHDQQTVHLSEDEYEGILKFCESLEPFGNGAPSPSFVLEDQLPDYLAVRWGPKWGFEQKRARLGTKAFIIEQSFGE